LRRDGRSALAPCCAVSVGAARAAMGARIGRDSAYWGDLPRRKPEQRARTRGAFHTICSRASHNSSRSKMPDYSTTDRSVRTYPERRAQTTTRTRAHRRRMRGVGLAPSAGRDGEVFMSTIPQECR
jgi:hypothetical protein